MLVNVKQLTSEFRKYIAEGEFEYRLFGSESKHFSHALTLQKSTHYSNLAKLMLTGIC